MDSDSCTIRYAHTANAGGHLAQRGGYGQLDRYPGSPGGIDERGQVCQLGLRRERGGLVVAQHAEQPPHLRQRLAGHLAQRAELGPGRFGQAG